MFSLFPYDSSLNTAVVFPGPEATKRLTETEYSTSIVCVSEREASEEASDFEKEEERIARIPRSFLSYVVSETLTGRRELSDMDGALRRYKCHGAN